MSHPVVPTLGRRQFVGLVAAAAAVVGLGSISACSSNTSPSNGGPSNGSRLRISTADGSTNDSLDPLRVERLMQNLCVSMIFEALIDIDQDMRPVGRLAESFGTPDGGATWDFTLHRNIMMHDGEPLTSEDVRFCIARALDPNEGSGNSLAGQLKGILRPQGIIAVDDRTVRFVLDKKYVFFPTAMATRFSRIYRAGTKNFDRPVGSGPFMFKSFKPGQSFVATRFDKYWDGAPGVERVEVNNYPEESTRLASFLDGDDDVMMNLDTSSAPAILAAGDRTIIEEKDSQWVPVALDTTVAPFDNPDVVRAIKLAVDRDQVVAHAMGGYGSIGYDEPIPADDNFFAGLPLPTYDPDAARDLLAKAGYGNGITLPTLEVLDLPVVLSMVLVLQQQLKDVGIRFDINRVPAATYWSTSFLQRPFYSNALSRRSTADETLKLFFSSDGAWNMSKRKDPEIDQAIESAANTTDIEEQKRQYTIAQRLIAERDSTIVSAHAARLSAVGANVSGVTANPVHTLDVRKAGTFT
ncbi:ABC transporter substrate-binding protein [Rhodococcus opacus]|nr:ABC transporter substrate-binding protein [Rhodococcus opacus]